MMQGHLFPLQGHASSGDGAAYWMLRKITASVQDVLVLGPLGGNGKAAK